LEKNSGSGLEIQEYDFRDPLCCPRNTLYPQKWTLTSPSSGSHLPGIVSSQTKATEFVCLFFVITVIIIIIITANGFLLSGELDAKRTVIKCHTLNM
jgi:hypothetical protein